MQNMGVFCNTTWGCCGAFFHKFYLFTLLVLSLKDRIVLSMHSDDNNCAMMIQKCN